MAVLNLKKGWNKVLVKVLQGAGGWGYYLRCRPWNKVSPWIIREKKANCFEGAIFAAAALHQIGHKPLVRNLRVVNDDDHVIALLKKNGRWGLWLNRMSNCFAFGSLCIRT